MIRPEAHASVHAAISMPAISRAGPAPARRIPTPMDRRMRADDGAPRA